jgi:glycosyltransferase involved in cell wall biosynthesis
VLDGVPVVRMPFHQAPRRARHAARELRFRRELPHRLRILRRTVATWRADVVLSLAIDSYATYAAGLARLVPVVLGLETGGPGLTTRPRLMRRALRRADRIVAVAESLAREATALAPEIRERIHVVPNGVDPARFGNGPAFVHPRPFVVVVARLSREKGVDVLLDALGCDPAAPFDLLVAGDGPERTALEAQAARLGVGDRVVFLGAVDQATVAALHRGAILVALPSRWEGLPLACLEAMASGCAVAAAAVGGLPEAIEDDRTGVLVPPEDPAALAAALRALASDPARRRRLGAAARTTALERFAWPVVARRHLAVLEVAVRARAGGV